MNVRLGHVLATQRPRVKTMTGAIPARVRKVTVGAGKHAQVSQQKPFLVKHALYQYQKHILHRLGLWIFVLV